MTYGEVAEAAWRWVLTQVRWSDGVWFPEPGEDEPSPYRDGLHGIGGLAYVLAEIRRTREWTVEEARLAAAIAGRLLAGIPDRTDYSYFDGLVSTIGVLTALEVPGAEAAVARLGAIATPDGWAQPYFAPPKYLPDSRANDLVLGTAGVLLGAVWAARSGLPGARELGERAAGLLMAEAVPVPAGLDWPFMNRRFRTVPGKEMPNFSHGLAGIATTLALAGAQFDRPDLVTAAVAGAEHLVTLGVLDDGGFRVPRFLPPDDPPGDADTFTHNWCHGGAGTSLLFAALHRAGVAAVAGAEPLVWHRRCLRGVRTSGLPARLHPGFWDNDGRCCGTAGVGEVFLDAWHRAGEQDDLAFAVLLADTLVDHAVHDGDHVYWRFTEHRADEPLLPPGVGWYQGAAGIAAYLFRMARVERDGRAAATVARMDNWWAQ